MSSPAFRNLSHLLTPRKLPVRKQCVTPDKVARCLFSTDRATSHLSLGNSHFTTPTRNKKDIQDVPSFDTPQRNLLSPSDFRSKVKAFILGSGSFGTVVKGKYKNKKVAVKIIPKNLDLLVESSTNREANALRLNHPNIIQVLDVVQQRENNMEFVLMEQYSHKNLDSLLQEDIIPLKIKLRYLTEIASALEHCHNNNVLHLDVKPKNVIVNAKDNSCKLCDFGSSKNKDDERKSESPSKGTLKYTAPELLRGKPASEKADTYSFGITMWQILHQQVPYPNEDLHIIVYKVVTQDYRPKSEGPITYNTNLESIYKDCWDHNPEKRPTMSQVSRSLENIKSFSKVKKCLL